MRMKRIVPFLLLMGLLNSCATTKLSQCQRIILVTQKMAKESEKYRQSEDVEEVLAVADKFEEAAEEMKKLKIEDEQLATYQKGFAEIYLGNANTTRRFIEALQNKDITTARVMKEQVQQLGQKERKLGTGMNEYCQAD